MKEGRKQAVSLRVSNADLRKVKLLAQRLGARESDVIRFAVKAMLGRLAPLCDPNSRGRDLLPTLMEAGGDFFHHFELDASRVVEIVNEGVSEAQEVEPDDLELLVTAGMHEAYARLRLHIRQATPAFSIEPEATTTDSPGGRLRGYLYSKYADEAKCASEDPLNDASNDG